MFLGEQLIDEVFAQARVREREADLATSQKEPTDTVECVAVASAVPAPVAQGDPTHVRCSDRAHRHRHELQQVARIVPSTFAVAERRKVIPLPAIEQTAIAGRRLDEDVWMRVCGFSERDAVQAEQQRITFTHAKQLIGPGIELLAQARNVANEIANARATEPFETIAALVCKPSRRSHESSA